MLTEGQHTGEFLVSEANGRRSRQTVTFKSGHTIKPGMVLGKLNSGGKFVPLDTSASSGAEKAAAIAWDHVDAADDDVEGVVIDRDAEVRGSGLIWPDEIGDDKKSDAKSKLAERGIKVR
ncbi:head decoration protein [Halorhodospira sp. 9622]|uniref:head decoration protein n=1 Tax=Halorhodospira sp. 9622 TaxID=2899136 RepID=UPI001EE93C05|nr:head decoration protein [Halorhodospira sp. 9622]MCG5538951.1 head decoration protein [Halorhodospira sp. 9622]